MGGSDFRSKFFEIWAARRARTKGAYFRETCVFRFAWRIHGSRCCTPRRSVVQRRYDAYNRLQGVSRCLNARPGAPRDSAPAAVYVVFGPALKKLWKQKFKLVMALPTSRYLESFANWADFIEITKRNLGGSPAKLCPGPSQGAGQQVAGCADSRNLRPLFLPVGSTGARR